MGMADDHGLPLALLTESASPAEVKLVKPPLPERFVPELPEFLIGDKAYATDRLDERRHSRYGIALIAQQNQPARAVARRPPAAPLPPPLKRERLFAGTSAA